MDYETSLLSNVFSLILNEYELATLVVHYLVIVCVLIMATSSTGILYFLLIPSMYLFLMIYSMCNMHVVSWGTREVAQAAPRGPPKQQTHKEVSHSQTTNLFYTCYCIFLFTLIYFTLLIFVLAVHVYTTLHYTTLHYTTLH